MKVFAINRMHNKNSRSIVMLIILLFSMTIISCSREKEVEEISGMNECNISKSYYDLVDSLDENYAYALIKTAEDDVMVLLVADMTYEYDGINASPICDVNYAEDGLVWKLGSISAIGGLGTAYPVSYDKDGIYVGMHHDISRFVIDKNSRTLVLLEYATVSFDNEGNESYVYHIDNYTISVPDDTFLIEMFDVYNNATVVNFMSK